MRRVTIFHCGADRLAGTLDAASGGSGLLIVSGGNEIRIGAHRGMAELAARLAAHGHPVFRFDRRGIGDSTGENRGYDSSADDIAAAIEAFRAEQPHLKRIVAFGNCDAASALVLHNSPVDARVIANPWVVETHDAMPPPAAIKAHYLNRLRDPKAWVSLFTGAINLRKLVGGLSKVATAKPAAVGSLSDRVISALKGASIPTTILLARGDGTAIAFADAWPGDPAIPVITLDSNSHSFASDADMAALENALLHVLAVN
jgi:exosortase A-associated hydrolase 1